MTPRGSRLACSLHSIDGAVATYSVWPGEEMRSLKKVEPPQWDKPPQREVQQALFTLIGDMGMTGTMVVLNQSQWRVLEEARLVEPFYAAILWGGNALKVVDDATLLAKGRGG